MVLLTCDSDINLALMSSSANEVTERVRSGGSGAVAVSPPTLNLRANHLRAVTAATDAVTAATDAVAGATDAGSQLTRFHR